MQPANFDVFLAVLERIAVAAEQIVQSTQHRVSNELPVEQRAVLLLLNAGTEINSLAELARRLDLAASTFYADKYEGVRAMFQSLHSAPIQRGRKLNNGTVEANE